MASKAQTFKNHVRFLPAFHFFVIPVLLLNALNAIRHVWLAPNRGTVWALIVAAALLTLGSLSRTMALRVQDRLIRLEMRLRLQQCLPLDLRTPREVARRHLERLGVVGDRPHHVALRLAGPAAVVPRPPSRGVRRDRVGSRPGAVGEPARRQAPPVPTATQGMNFDVPGSETAPGPGISPDGSTIVLYDGGMQKTLTSVAA